MIVNVMLSLLNSLHDELWQIEGGDDTIILHMGTYFSSLWFSLQELGVPSCFSSSPFHLREGE